MTLYVFSILLTRLKRGCKDNLFFIPANLFAKKNKLFLKNFLAYTL